MVRTRSQCYGNETVVVFNVRKFSWVNLHLQKGEGGREERKRGERKGKGGGERRGEGREKERGRREKRGNSEGSGCLVGNGEYSSSYS